MRWEPPPAEAAGAGRLRLPAVPAGGVDGADFPAVGFGVEVSGQVIEKGRQLGVGVVVVGIEAAAGQAGERAGAGCPGQSG
jgi:hypothetical protein